MRRPRVSALAIMLAAVCAATDAAAAITVRAHLDSAQLRVGRATDLTVEASGAQDVPVPQVPAPRGVTVRYVGPATQLSIVNGRTNASITHHFSVVAQSAGTYTIGPITLDYGGQRYDAGTVTLQVLAANAPAPSGGTGAAAQEPLGLALSAPKTDVYLHERLPVRIALSVGNVRVTDVEYPKLDGEGFALDKFGQPSQHEERTASGTVQVAEFATTLTPLRSGPLTVGPARLSLNTIVRRRGGDIFGQFFGGSREPVELTSDPLTLNVLPLPEEGKPADFSGAVGKFQFDVRAAPLEVQAGDPVTLTMTIRGTGNLEHVTTPTIPESDALRVYPAQPSNPGATPAPGSTLEDKTFEQVVIPQHPGAVALPALRFSYFDPESRAYRTITHPPIPVSVRPAARSAQAPEVVGGAPAAPRAEPLGRDIVFIKDTPGTLRPIGTRWYAEPAFWAYQLVPLAAWLAAVAWDRRRRRLRGDVGYARYTRAGREARAALAGARAALKRGDRVAFYDAVAGAVRDYLSAKLDLPPGSVTPDAVGERLRGNALAPRVATELRDLFTTCERVRFAPTSDGDRDMPETLARAEDIVRRLERTRKLAPPLAAALVVALVIPAAATIGRATTAAHADALPVAASAAADGQAAPAEPAREPATKLPASHGAPGAVDPHALFFQANALYASEHYPEAAATYEKILAAGRESGHLYFNLGNAYFRSGDLGRAILEYERARRLIPGDPDLHANLTFARTEAGTPEEEPIYARLLFPLASRLNSDTLLIAASIAYTIVMLALILARFLPVAARLFKAIAVAGTIACAALSSSAGYRLATVDLPAYAVVVARQETTVRFEPSATGTAHFAAKPGSVLRVLGERDDWAQVARHDGQRGWIERAALARI